MVSLIFFVGLGFGLNKKTQNGKTNIRHHLIAHGVAGLIYAGISFMNGGGGIRNIKTIIFSGILGGIFFFSGIRLITNTNDKAT